MSESLQHIIDGIYTSQEKRSNLDYRIGTYRDSTPPLFMERKSHDELIKLVWEIKTELKKPLSGLYVYQKVIEFLKKAYDDKSVIRRKDVIKILNNLETHKTSIKVKIYNLDIDKDSTYLSISSS